MGREWRIDVQLRIGGQGVSLYGDGAAVWLTKEPFEEGEVFARKASWTGLGLFLDTYDNAPGKHVHKHPYISAFLSTGTHAFSYAELEADDEALQDPSHAASRAHAGCHARIRQYGRDPKVVTVRLEYDWQVKELRASVFLGRRRDQYRSAAKYAWQHCFTLHSVDLPPGYWLAASASTGQLTDAHEVLSIETRGQQGAHESQVPNHVRNGTPDPNVETEARKSKDMVPPATPPEPAFVRGGRSVPAVKQAEPALAAPETPKAADPVAPPPSPPRELTLAELDDRLVASDTVQQMQQGIQRLSASVADLADKVAAVGQSKAAPGDTAALDNMRRRMGELASAVESISSRIGRAADAGEVQRANAKVTEVATTVAELQAAVAGGGNGLLWLVAVGALLLGGGALFLAATMQRRLSKMHLP